MNPSPRSHGRPSTPLLPVEIITIILLCLPTESLLRFKSVCLPTESLLRFKSVCNLWYQVITHDSHFTAAHLRRSPLQLITQHPFRPSLVARNDEGILTVNLDLISNTTQIERTLGITYDGTRGSYARLLTSYNGLLYFNQYDGYGWVCNPLLGEWVALPLSQNIPDGEVCGFFFHKSSNQYRLLRVSNYNKSEPHFNFEILTLGTESWRSIPCSTSHHFDAVQSPVIFNNALHWPAIDGPHIIVFGMDVEDFQLIDQPPGFTPKPGWVTFAYLTKMEGCLCLGRFHSDNMEIWVLKDYNNVDAGSWERRYVFSIETLGIRVDCLYFLNGELVFAHRRDGLVYYNLSFNSFRMVPHSNQEENSRIKYNWLSVYQKSLISLLNLDKTRTNHNISTVSVRVAEALVD